MPTIINSSNPASAASFDWPVALDAEAFLRERTKAFLDRNPAARYLAERMNHETGTDFFEWIDHFVLPPEDEASLEARGFTRDAAAETTARQPVFEHSRATFPRVLIRPGPKGIPSLIALRPESVADFAARQHLGRDIEGEPFSRYRRITVAVENGTQLDAADRRAYRGFVPAPLSAAELSRICKARELWHTRLRLFDDESRGFEAAFQLLRDSIELVGRDLTCHFFFEAERAYWETRNRTARMQKYRQDQLGLGWGNHDHHTFRCSRRHFLDLVRFLIQLGFAKRERYYAGAEAGWGAQILEHELTGIVVFADVDLMPDETAIDFSTEPLSPVQRLGTVGLWVGLHGESFLEAGMHHLEARFEFAELRDQLQKAGIVSMKPFSDFEFLRQAFTEGERWPVRRARLDPLLAGGLITREQFEKFLIEGAIGSHLENLQRHGGYRFRPQRNQGGDPFGTGTNQHPGKRGAAA